MNNCDLREATGTGIMMAKLGKDENVSMDAILRICEAFHCDVASLD